MGNVNELKDFTREQLDATLMKIGDGVGMGTAEGLKAFLRGELEIRITGRFREMEEVQIQIPALPRPTLSELQAKHSWVRSIEKDDAPEESVTLCLGTLLRQGEKRISGEEYEKRRLSLAGKMHGYQQAEWLVKHQDALPALMALIGKVYIDFPGLVVAGAVGYRSFPYLHSDGERWYLFLDWNDDDLRRFGRLAVSGK